VSEINDAFACILVLSEFNMNEWIRYFIYAHLGSAVSLSRQNHEVKFREQIEKF
jgi:hypothetical protein